MPAITVVVASHERPLRLRWLLNALAEQELDRARWEVVVCFDDAGEETARLLATHPLAAAGVLRALRLPAADDVLEHLVEREVLHVQVLEAVAGAEQFGVGRLEVAHGQQPLAAGHLLPDGAGRDLAGAGVVGQDGPEPLGAVEQLVDGAVQQQPALVHDRDLVGDARHVGE